MLTKLIGLFILSLSALVGWGWMDYRATMDTPTVFEKPVEFEVKPGDSLNTIINRLLKLDVKIKPHWFKLEAYRNKVQAKIKTGEYELPVGIKPAELLNLLVKGKSKRYSVTFPEGWTIKQVIQQIQKSSKIKLTIPLKSYHNVLVKALDIKENHLEGLFFPDTYFFEKNTKDITILRKAYRKMKVILDVEWNARSDDLPLKSSYEALILASIVEKETGQSFERPEIAGVFVRRLRQNMLLQTDPTVIYGMGDKYDGNITRKNLRQPTPYNTYTIKGLPPTPIALPGKEAIHAALHPANGKSIYFVGRGDGTHVFSKTLAEHNRAVNRFQRKVFQR